MDLRRFVFLERDKQDRKMSVVLDVTVRENTGTGGARAARRDGLVPGVIYGGDEASVAVSVKYLSLIHISEPTRPY